MFSAPIKGRTPPIITRETEFFWEGTRAHRLLIQRCLACGETRHPPGPACPRCHSLDWEPTQLPRQGRLYSFMVQHRPLSAGFDSPYIVGVIEFDGGIRLVSNIIDIDPELLEIGELVEVVFIEQEEGWTAPQFRRASSG